MNKKELRRQIREKKRQFSDLQLEELSLPVIERLLAHPAVAGAKTILMYYSLADEVNTHNAIRAMAEEGKNVLLPRVISSEEMEIRRYKSDKDLAEGSYGIMEPTGELFTEYEKIDVAIIPGMSFDSYNNRLGRGKGYYDRFLAKVPHMYKIGVCFDFQKLETIPAYDNDIKMNLVI